MALAPILGNISAGLSIASGIKGLFGGGGSNRKDASRAAKESADLQRYLWKNQIPDLVEGAKSAGLHPLVGAGVNPASGPTVGVVGDTGPTAMDRMEQLGQGVGRAAQALQSNEQRMFNEASQALILEKMKLENDLLRSQNTVIHRASNPPMPSTSSALVEKNPFQQTMYNPNGSHAEPASVSDVGYVRTGSGGLAKVPSKEAKERIEDMILPELEWFMRNRINPFSAGRSSPNGVIPPPKGYDGWRWNYWSQEYVPHKNRKWR